jgi:large subunit ribosomal protein L25
MAENAKLPLGKRTKLGSAECRRLRKQGLIPGNVYGHHQEPLAISVAEDQLGHIIATGARVVDIDIDGAVEKAMFRDVQWDTFGLHIQHFDLLRIDATERVTVDVPIELRGIAPGTLSGGVLEQHQRSLTIECLAFEIPTAIPVRIGALEIGGVIHVSDVEVPGNMKVLNPPDVVVVQIVQPVEMPELVAAGEAGPAEPEVIGRKAEEAAEEE